MNCLYFYLKPCILFALCICPLSAQDSPLTVQTPAAKQSPPMPAETPSSDQVTVEITKGHRISGDLADLTEITVTTGFGEAKFPVAEIEGIKLHADENDSAIFAFKNGDIVTGQLKLETISISTAWGDANIRVASIETLRFNKKGEFYQDSSVSGKQRWRFGETREVTRQINNGRPNVVQPQPFRGRQR